MSSQLISTMCSKYGYPLLTEETIDDYLLQHGQVVLFFTENPLHFPESNDVAVILPELMKIFGTRLEAAVIDRDSERVLHKRFGFKGWPSLVFLRSGQYLGVITRIRDWDEYVREFEQILDSGPDVHTATARPEATDSTAASIRGTTE